MSLGRTQSYLVQQSAIDAIPPFTECFLSADNVLMGLSIGSGMQVLPRQIHSYLTVTVRCAGCIIGAQKWRF